MKASDITMIGLRAGMTVAAITTLQLAPVAHATTTPDPLRCHAFEMICESRYEDAMARCEHLPQHPATGASDATPTKKCENAADVRQADCLARTQARPVCGPPAHPSPHACAADQLQIGANFMMCTDRCDRPDDSQCDGTCEDRYGKDLSETRSSPICADGPMVAIPGLDPNAVPAADRN